MTLPTQSLLYVLYLLQGRSANSVKRTTAGQASGRL